FRLTIAGLLLVALAAAGSVGVALLQPAAIAQTISATGEVSFAQTLWTQVEPMVLTAVSTIVAALAIWISTWIADFFKVKNEETRRKMQEATRQLIHSVVWNAVKYAASKSDNTLLDKLAVDLPPPVDLIRIAKAYFDEMNPDLKEVLSENELENIIVSKLPDLINLVKTKTTNTVTT